MNIFGGCKLQQFSFVFAHIIHMCPAAANDPLFIHRIDDSRRCR